MTSLVQLGAGRDPVIHHQQVQALMAVLLMYGGDQHSLRGDAHHLAGRQVDNGDGRLAHQLLGLIILMDPAEDHAVLSGTVVQHELQKLLALGHGGTLLDLHRPEIGLGEGLKIHLFLKQRLDLHLGEIDGRLLLLLLGGGGLGLGGDVRGLHGGDKIPHME